MRSGLRLLHAVCAERLNLPPLSVFACHRHTLILSINLSVKEFYTAMIPRDILIENTCRNVRSSNTL